MKEIYWNNSAREFVRSLDSATKKEIELTIKRSQELLKNEKSKII